MCSLKAFPRGRFFPLLLVFCARCTFSLARKYHTGPRQAQGLSRASRHQRKALTALVAQKRSLTSARGNRKSGDSPGPRRGSSRMRERLHRLAALVAEDCLNCPRCGRNPLQSRRTGSFGGFGAAAGGVGDGFGNWRLGVWGRFGGVRRWGDVFLGGGALFFAGIGGNILKNLVIFLILC